MVTSKITFIVENEDSPPLPGGNVSRIDLLADFASINAGMTQGILIESYQLNGGIAPFANLFLKVEDIDKVVIGGVVSIQTDQFGRTKHKFVIPSGAKAGTWTVSVSDNTNFE